MANRNYTPVSKVTVDLSVLGWSSCLSLMFKGNFFSKCSIWCEALLVRFKTVLQVPVLTVFLETVRNLLLPFLQSNENIKEMKHTNFSLLRKGVCQLCKYLMPNMPPWIHKRIWCIWKSLLENWERSEERVAL